ncbi:MAG: pyrroline-5-carboxylate reductase [Gammaproteobacteria bacterium]|nr:pyrroline-5-carboxylate reductase [Gammaproteobacteria bacterium]
MARAMIFGLIESGVSAADIIGTTASEASAQALHDATGIATGTDNQHAVASAETVILAVKPQKMRDVCQALQRVSGLENKLFISVAAGITSDSMAHWLGNPTLAIIRSMPNTPAQIQLGAIGAYANANTSAEQRDTAHRVLSSMGLAVWVEAEAQIDAVTALSGSGAAYVYLFCELMQNAGEQLGLSADISAQLAAQTFKGAGAMLVDSQITAKQLRINVTSPNGTTEQALKVFANRQLDAIVLEAMSAANQRSQQLAAELGSQE